MSFAPPRRQKVASKATHRVPATQHRTESGSVSVAVAAAAVTVVDSDQIYQRKPLIEVSSATSQSNGNNNENLKSTIQKPVMKRKKKGACRWLDCVSLLF
jgi:hypothetical protein